MYGFEVQRMAVQTWVTSQAIGADDVLARIGSPEDGAVVAFLGTVRNHHEGKGVEGIRYEAYESMAAEVLAQIAEEVAVRYGTDRVAVVHRTGRLEIGEASVAVGVSAPHRAEAFGAAQEIMSEIKRRVPVWKHEHFTDGTSEWVAGTPVDVPSSSPGTPPLDGAAAAASEGGGAP